MINFERVLLKDICTYRGERIGTTELDCTNYISTENMKPNRGGIIPINTLPSTKTVSKFLVNDILISNIRPYFKKIWFADREGGCSNDVLVIKNNEPSKVDTRYLYYCLYTDNFFDYVMSGAKGAKMPRGDKDEIMKYSLLIPTLDVQEKLVEILLNIDNKIALNSKTNETLEEIINAYYINWFIDFEPFKDGESVEIEEKKIPAGWKFGTVGELAQISSGKRPKVIQENGEVPIYGGAGIMGYTDVDLLDEDVFVIGRVGAYCGKEVFRVNGKSWPSDNALVVRLKQEDSYSLLYSRLKSFDFDKIKGGSSQPLITQSGVSNIPIIIPPTEIIGKFEEKVRAYHLKILQNDLENKRLHEVRNYILNSFLLGKFMV